MRSQYNTHHNNTKMGSIQRVEDLIAWQKAHDLVLAVYKATKSFPKEELFVLTSQIRRAAISMPSNITEGFKRISNADKIKFYNYAETSADEVRYQLFLAQQLNYLNTSEQQNLAQEVAKLVSGLINSIRAK